MHPVKIRAKLWLIFLLLVLAGCKPEPERPPKPKTAPPSPWRMVLETEPAKLRMNQPARFHVRLEDQGGKAVSGAQVQGSLNMPLMDMGKNEFPMAQIADGQYVGSSKMSMAGPWELVVTAKRDSQVGKQTFDLRVDE
jgi:hypothetical protein